MASTVLDLCCCNYSCGWSIMFLFRYSLPMQSLCKQLNQFIIQENGTMVIAQHNAARKWPLYLNSSWTDRLLQHCWLVTMIIRSACYTFNPFSCNSNQWSVHLLPSYSSHFLEALSHSVGMNMSLRWLGVDQFALWKSNLSKQIKSKPLYIQISINWSISEYKDFTHCFSRLKTPSPELSLQRR